MASITYYIECKNCKLAGYADDYYKMHIVYNYCPQCGYQNVTEHVYDQVLKEWSVLVEEKFGHGVFRKYSGDKSDALIRFPAPLSSKELMEYTRQYNKLETIQEKSYLVTFQNGEFNCLLGSTPDYFYLNREEMIEKYGDLYDDFSGEDDDWD